MSAGGVPVHDVVVQQREVVDQLHGGRRLHGGRVLTAERSRGGEYQGRADRLARVARRRGAVRVLPAEVVERDPAHGSRQRVDGSAERGVDGRPGVLQDARRLLSVHRAGRDLPVHGPPVRGTAVRGPAFRGLADAAPPVQGLGRTPPRPRCSRLIGREHGGGRREGHRQRPISTFSRMPRASGTRTAAE